MIEKITLSEALALVEDTGGLASVLGIDSSNLVKKRKQEEFQPAVTLISGTSASYIRHASSRYLATLADAKNCVLLVAKKGGTEGVNFTGLVGDIMALRGGPNSVQRIEYFHVAAFYAWNSYTIQINNIFTTVGYSVGRYLYHGEEYIGINFSSYPTTTVSFTGLYSTNCVFQVVTADQVSIVEDT